jgi:hypothetical protein
VGEQFVCVELGEWIQHGVQISDVAVFFPEAIIDWCSRQDVAGMRIVLTQIVLRLVITENEMNDIG